MRLALRTIIEITNCTEAEAHDIEMEIFDMPGFHWGNVSYSKMIKTINNVARSIGVINH